MKKNIKFNNDLFINFFLIILKIKFPKIKYNQTKKEMIRTINGVGSRLCTGTLADSLKK